MKCQFCKKTIPSTALYRVYAEKAFHFVCWKKVERIAERTRSLL